MKQDKGDDTGETVAPVHDVSRATEQEQGAGSEVPSGSSSEVASNVMSDDEGENLHLSEVAVLHRADQDSDDDEDDDDE
jgi:hypothetical protein